MAIQTQTQIGNCDGFSIVTPLGLIGWVEEMWIDRAGEPSALALRLLDGRRGLLIAAEIEEVVREHRLITVGRGVRVLELEPPHVNPGWSSDESLTASWTTTGRSLRLPEPPGQLHGAILSLHRPLVPAANGAKLEQPIWQVVTLMYTGLVLIAGALIGLDILIAYLATGRPPY